MEMGQQALLACYALGKRCESLISTSDNIVEQSRLIAVCCASHVGAVTPFDEQDYLLPVTS